MGDTADRHQPAVVRVDDRHIDRNGVDDRRRWRLNIDGLVEKPLALTLDALQRFEPMHQLITLSCISNPVGGDLIGTTRWTGVSLARLLPNLRLQAGATHLKIRARTDFMRLSRWRLFGPTNV